MSDQTSKSDGEGSPAKRFSKIAIIVLLLVLAGVVAFFLFRAPNTDKLMARADEFYQAGNNDAARIECRRVLQEEPKHGPAHHLLGRIWFEEGAPMRALHHLLRGQEAGVVDTEGQGYIAKSMRLLGQFGEAREQSLNLLERQPDHLSTLLLLAEMAVTPEEVTQIKEVVEKVPDHSSVSYHLPLAILAMKGDDLKEAKRRLQAAYESDAESPEVHLVGGNWHLLSGDPEEAKVAMKRAAELSPPRSAGRRKYAEFLASHGEPGEADAYLTTLVEEHQGDLQAWRLKARLAMNEKDYDKALDCLKPVLEANAVDYAALLIEARILQLTGETARARARWEQIDQIYLNIPKVKLELARAYYQNGELAKASAAIEQVIAQNPNYTEARLLLAWLRVRQGNFSAAVDIATEVLAAEPTNLDARMLLVDALRLDGKSREAVAVLEEQLERTPGDARLHLLYGQLQRLLNDPEKARESLARASALNPDDLTPKFQLAEMDLAEGDLEAARRRTATLVEHHPDSPEVRYYHAMVLNAGREWDLAAAALDKALEINPEFTVARGLAVSVALVSGKLEEARGHLDSLLERNPESPQALLLLGRLQEVKGEFEEAQATYEQVLAVQSDNVRALNNLAYLYDQYADRLDDAYELANKARTLNSTDPSVADTLAWILYKKGEYQRALSLSEESAQAMPKVAEVRYHLGMINYAMNRSAQAEAALGEALALDPDGEWAETANARLSLLRGMGEMGVSELESLLAQQPGDPLVLQRLAAAYEKAGRADDAAAAYAKVLAANAGSVESLIGLARLHAGPLADSAKALEYGTKAKGLAPDDPQVAELLGGLAFESGKFEQAYNLLTVGSRQQAQFSTSMGHKLAWAAYSCGHLAEARRLMEKIVNGHPEAGEAADATSFLGMIVPWLENGTAPEAEINAILKGDPNHVPALMQKGALLAGKSDVAGAIASYQQVMKLYPQFPPAKRELAIHFAGNADQLEQAWTLGREARETMTEDAELARVMGEMAVKRESFTYAVQLLEESGRAKPLDAEGLFYLGKAQHGMGEKAKAKETLGKAIAAGLDGSLKEEAAKLLEEEE